MKVTILCVGRIKEKYFTDACAEYTKRLSKFCDLNICEVLDEKTPDGASEAENLKIKDTEGKRIISKIPKGAFVYTLEIGGKAPDSVALSEEISKEMSKGKSHLCFIIGGSLGLSPEVVGLSNYHLSFSKLTFPHQLMRVILLEQLYRSFKIMAHEPYHK